MMARGQKMQQSLMSFVIQNFPIFFRGNWPFWRFTVIPFFLWMACYWIDDCGNIFLFSKSIDSVILWAGFVLAFADICASCWCSVNAERDIPFVQVNCTDTFRSIYALCHECWIIGKMDRFWRQCRLPPDCFILFLLGYTAKEVYSILHCKSRSCCVEPTY